MSELRLDEFFPKPWKCTQYHGEMDNHRAVMNMGSELVSCDMTLNILLPFTLKKSLLRHERYLRDKLEDARREAITYLKVLVVELEEMNNEGS